MRAVWLSVVSVFFVGSLSVTPAVAVEDLSSTEAYKTCMQSSDYDLAAPLCENAAQWLPANADKKNKYNLDMLLKA